MFSGWSHEPPSIAIQPPSIAISDSAALDLSNDSRRDHQFIASGRQKRNDLSFPEQKERRSIDNPTLGEGGPC